MNTFTKLFEGGTYCSGLITPPTGMAIVIKGILVDTGSSEQYTNFFDASGGNLLYKIEDEVAYSPTNINVGENKTLWIEASGTGSDGKFVQVDYIYLGCGKWPIGTPKSPETGRPS